MAKRMLSPVYYTDKPDDARLIAHKLCDLFVQGEITAYELETEIAAHMRQYAETPESTDG